MKSRVYIGTDIVFIPGFKEQMFLGGKEFQKRVFHSSELISHTESLAGVFAAKEAVIKALSLPVGSWLNFKISKTRTGRPEVKFSNELRTKYSSWDVSITHAGDYAVAVFVAF